MAKLDEALDKLERFRFPGDVPDKYASLDMLAALTEYIEAAEQELETAAASLKELRDLLAKCTHENAALHQQVGLANIKLGGIAMLLQGR